MLSLGALASRRLSCKIGRSGSGLGTWLCARWEGMNRGHAPSSPAAPRSPAASPPDDREGHTDSLETRSPSLWQTAASLDTEAGRPLQLSINREAPRASRPTAPEGRPIVAEPWRAVAGLPPTLAHVRPAVAGCPHRPAPLRLLLADTRKRFLAVRQASPALRQPQRNPGRPLPASRPALPTFGNLSPRTGHPSRRSASLGRRSATVSRTPANLPEQSRRCHRTPCESTIESSSPLDYHMQP